MGGVRVSLFHWSFSAFSWIWCVFNDYIWYCDDIRGISDLLNTSPTQLEITEMLARVREEPLCIT